MAKKSMICYQCGKNGKVPIYFRDENRAFKVAFYACKYCMNFSGFIETYTRKTKRIMPYFDDMRGLIKMRLCKNNKDKESDLQSHKNKVLKIQKDPNAYCFKCKKFDYSKLYVRNRVKKTFDYVGYVCKWCRMGFFVNVTDLKLKPYDDSREYMGSFATQLPEDEERPIEEQLTITIKKKDLGKLKKSKIKFTTV